LAAAIEIAGLHKNYRGLRPLRIESLIIEEGDRVALSGLDVAAAEVLVNLISAATLPDAGDVRVFGRRTASVATADEWLASLDRVGVVTPRSVFLEGLTVLQNLALPLSLEVDPPSDAAARHARRLAAEVGVPEGELARRVADAPPDIRLRVHVGRAVALDPSLLLLEHPTTGLLPGQVPPIGRMLARCAAARRLTLLAITEDRRFAGAVARRSLRLAPATGVVSPRRRSWF
jgi:ABC-type transporter Mla maintaining outer membrane lipid asymmetry ATPase subunit MlaF